MGYWFSYTYFVIHITCQLLKRVSFRRRDYRVDRRGWIRIQGAEKEPGLEGIGPYKWQAPLGSNTEW